MDTVAAPFAVACAPTVSCLASTVHTLSSVRLVRLCSASSSAPRSQEGAIACDSCFQDCTAQMRRLYMSLLRSAHVELGLDCRCPEKSDCEFIKRALRLAT